MRLEIWENERHFESTSSFHPQNNLSIKEEPEMVNTCLLPTGESMFHPSFAVAEARKKSEAALITYFHLIVSSTV